VVFAGLLHFLGVGFFVVWVVKFLGGLFLVGSVCGGFVVSQGFCGFSGWKCGLCLLVCCLVFV